jgi:hypothetical protein
LIIPVDSTTICCRHGTEASSQHQAGTDPTTLADDEPTTVSIDKLEEKMEGGGGHTTPRKRSNTAGGGAAKQPEPAAQKKEFLYKILVVGNMGTSFPIPSPLMHLVPSSM